MGLPKESAQDMTYTWLRRHVASFPRHSGGFITESEVATALKISRTPVREAMLRLEAEGFLQILPKKGAYVSPISDEETKAVMQARSLVEGWCVRRLAVGVPGLVEELHRLMAELESLSSDPVAFIECDRRFHRTLVEAAGNPVIASFYESLRDRQVRMGLQAVTASKNRAARVLAEHWAITDAVRDLEPDAAAAAVTRHLDSTRAILLATPATGSWSSVPDLGSAV